MSIHIVDSSGTCKNIKRILNERNISPKEVQNALHLESVQAVYKWLSPSNKTMPSLDSLIQLAHFLECRVEDIVVVKEMGE